MEDERKLYVTALNDFRERMLDKLNRLYKSRGGFTSYSYCDIVEWMNEAKLELEAVKYEGYKTETD